MDTAQIARASAPQTAVDWIADSFADAPRATIPVEEDEPWQSVTELARSPRIVLGLFPAILNIDMRFHRAVRAAPAVVCTFAVEQLAVAARMAPLLDIGSVILLERDLPKARAAIDENAIHPDYLSILALTDDPRGASDAQVRREIHALPGVPILTECALHGAGERVFHPCDRFEWEYGSTITVRDARERFKPLSLPRAAAHASECACGARDALTF